MDHSKLSNLFSDVDTGGVGQRHQHCNMARDAIYVVRVPLACDVALLLQPSDLLLDERSVQSGILHGRGPHSLLEKTHPRHNQASA